MVEIVFRWRHAFQVDHRVIAGVMVTVVDMPAFRYWAVRRLPYLLVKVPDTGSTVIAAWVKVVGI